MRIPVTGISAMPLSGTRPVRSREQTTGATPAAIGSQAHHQVPFLVMQPARCAYGDGVHQQHKREQQRQGVDDPADHQGDDGELDRRAHAGHGDLACPAQVGDGGHGGRRGQQHGEYDPEGDIDRQQHPATLRRNKVYAGASETLI